MESNEIKESLIERIKGAKIIAKNNYIDEISIKINPSELKFINVHKLNLNAKVMFKLTEYGNKINKFSEHPLLQDTDGHTITTIWEMSKYFANQIVAEEHIFENDLILLTDKIECIDTYSE